MQRVDVTEPGSENFVQLDVSDGYIVAVAYGGESCEGTLFLGPIEDTPANREYAASMGRLHAVAGPFALPLMLRVQQGLHSWLGKQLRRMKDESDAAFGGEAGEGSSEGAQEGTVFES